MTTNIKHVVEKPKVIGVVDLTKFNKGKKENSSKETGSKEKALSHRVWQNFPATDYNAVLEIVRAANLKIGKDAVTISKIAKVDGVEVPGFCSIWYACPTIMFKTHFRRSYEIFLLERRWTMRRIFKKDILKLDYGIKFLAVYIKDDLSAIDVIKNVKIHNGNKNEKLGVWYVGSKDTSKTPYCLKFEDINEDGSFNTGMEHEIGYLYVDVALQNI